MVKEPLLEKLGHSINLLKEKEKDEKLIDLESRKKKPNLNI